MEAEAKPAGYGALIGLTWRSLLRAMARAPLAFIGSLVALALIGVGFGLLDRVIAKIPSSNLILQVAGGAAAFLAALARSALVSLALAPVAIAVHRLVIVDEVSLRRVGVYAAWLFGLLFFWKAVQLPTLLFGEGSFALKYLMIGIVGAVVLRSALLFPALAIDGVGGSIKQRVEEGWRISRGHLRRLFAVWVGAALPLIIVAVLLSRKSADATAVPGLHIVAGVVGAALTTAAMAVSAAVTSWVYLWALDHPDANSQP